MAKHAAQKPWIREKSAESIPQGQKPIVLASFIYGLKPVPFERVHFNLHQNDSLLPHDSHAYEEATEAEIEFREQEDVKKSISLKFPGFEFDGKCMPRPQRSLIGRKFHTGRSGYHVQTKIENAPFGKSLSQHSSHPCHV